MFIEHSWEGLQEFLSQHVPRLSFLPLYFPELTRAPSIIVVWMTGWPRTAPKPKYEWYFYLCIFCQSWIWWLSCGCVNVVERSSNFYSFLQVNLFV
jgi:hypothetical protein